MNEFILEKAKYEEYQSHSGLALVGTILNKVINFSQYFFPKFGDISDSDLLKSYIGLLAIGKSDYEAISGKANDKFFKKAFGIKRIPSSVTLRQRMDSKSVYYSEIIEECMTEVIKKSNAPVTALDNGYTALDIDVFPMDNSNTKKEGVSRTYHNYDGYAPIAGYIGNEGWCIGLSLRPGSQHSQNDFVPFLHRSINNAKYVTNNKKLLARLDSGHDALETQKKKI